MKFTFTPYIYILIFLNFNLYAQELILNPKISNPDLQNIFKDIRYNRLNSNEKDLFQQTDSIRYQLQKKGYLNNEIEKIEINGLTYTVAFRLNKKLEQIRIRYDSSLPAEITHIISSKNNSAFIDIPFDQVENTLNRIVSEMERSGNSFAEAYLKNIRIENGKAQADLVIENIRQRTIDKVIVKGYEEFPESFIKYRLQLKEGNTFNLQKLETASINTKSLGFVHEIKPPEVLFATDSTFIYLFLEKKRSNTFDGLIGFSSKTEGSGLDLNGYLDVKLNNIFNHGEHISLLWKSNGNNSQQFDLATALPYIFKSPVSPELSLNIYKQDTSFINTNFNLAVYFDILKNTKIAAVYNSENSTDLKEISSSENISSYKKNKYGLDLSYSVFRNDLLFPEKFSFNIKGLYANRKSESETSNQNIFELRLNYLWEISRKNYLFVQNQSGMISSETLYTNELFRIGGINSIRGFNEESIPVSAYSIINFEYRYKTNAESYFYALTDAAWFSDQIKDVSSNIFGFGLGYSFLTRAGRINLIYALGKFKDEPLNFNNSKLHLKIVNYF